MEKMLWVLGAWAGAGALSHAEALATPAIATTIDRGLALPEPSSSWPWVALGAILVLLAVIALAARRRLPFGRRL